MTSILRMQRTENSLRNICILRGNQCEEVTAPIWNKFPLARFTMELLANCMLRAPWLFHEMQTAPATPPNGTNSCRQRDSDPSLAHFLVGVQQNDARAKAWSALAHLLREPHTCGSNASSHENATRERRQQMRRRWRGSLARESSVLRLRWHSELPRPGAHQPLLHREGSLRHPPQSSSPSLRKRRTSSLARRRNFRRASREHRIERSLGR